MKLNHDPHLHRYVYIFEGTATFQGSPVARASVLVRVLTEEGTVSKGTLTDDQGNYRLEVAINAPDNDPVDYVMEAYSPESQKVVMVGRRITTQEEARVTIGGTLALLPSIP